MTQAIVWSMNGCPYCDKAKELLDNSGIDYEERNIMSEEWSKEQLLEAVPGARTVPQIFLNNKYIGGYNELYTYYEDHNMFNGNTTF